MRKNLNLKPFKPTHVQFLSAEDYQYRVECCRAILSKYDNPVRRNKIFFTDECAVYAAGRNKQTVFWSKQNPHFWQQVRQHPPSIMIWAAMSADYLIGPFFITGTLNAEAYVNLLATQFLPELQRKGLIYSHHFQQDGAPAHTAHISRQFLNEKFPDRWIGKFSDTPWPARSPDLTSCDNALWGILKPRIIAHNATTVDELKAATTEEFANFDRETLKLINDRTFRRFQICIDNNGLQVDPFDI